MRYLTCSLVFAAAFLAAVSPASAQLSFTEDFSTTTYKDAANTTADWNTAAGELRLFPFAITSVGTFNTAGTAVGAAISGNLLFVADDPNVAILDITNVAAPTLLGTFASVGAQGVEIQGDLLYVAAGTSGLKIVNVTNPAAPVLAGTFNTPDIAFDVAVEGDVAYVANGLTGLLVFDVSNPAAPVQIGSYNTPGNALRVDVSGNHCYIADRFGSGIVILDVTNPALPALLGSIVLVGDTWSVVVDGDLAYVGDASGGFSIVDVSDPTAPTQIGFMDPGTARQLSVAGDLVYAAGFSVVHVIDVSDPTNPVLVDSYDNPGSCNDVVVDGEHAFVADGTSGIQVIQVRSAMHNPVPVGAYDTAGTANSIAVAGDHAFVADGFAGLRIVDISNPAAPVNVGFIDTPSSARDVAVAGDNAFVADLSSLRVIDISNPAAPVEVASLASLAGTYESITVEGNHAFLPQVGFGLRVIDIEDPTSPISVGFLPFLQVGGGLAVAGDHAFWADGDGFRVVNIANPAAPVSVGFDDVAWTTNDVAVAGDLAYVCGDSGLDVFNISNPSGAYSVGSTFTTSSRATSVALAGNYALLAVEDEGLKVLDITADWNATQVGEVALLPNVDGIAIAGDHAYVANSIFGLRVLQAFQNELDGGDNSGRSLVVDAGTDLILRSRLTTTQTGTVTWALGALGVPAQSVVPDGQWNKFYLPGTDLVWQSTHTLGTVGVNPTATALHLEWLVQSSTFNDITDVPDDQGGEVRVQFARSGYDFADETTTPATGYQLYQRVDAATAAVVASSSTTAAPVETHAALDGIDPSRARALGDRRFVVGPFEALAGVFPPGVWEAVGWVAATQQDVYTARVSTTADFTPQETNWSVYLITTHTTVPSNWFVSSIDSGYSVDNIAPGVPQNFAVAYNAGPGNTLSWDPASEPDFQFHRVYRSTNPTFVPTAGDLVHETSAPTWIDPEYDGWNVYYKVTTLDHAGNESDPASAGTTTDVAGPGVPTRYQLHANAPNPFNPSTQIRYDVPVSGEVVSIRVFDVAGRLVRTLVEGPQSAGTRSVGWNGRDERGRAVASGVYFYRMQAGSFVQTRKMALLK